MSPKPQIIEVEVAHSTKQKSSTNASVLKFKPVQVDLEHSRLSSRIKKLIRNGDGVERYDGDHSRAVFAACTQMIAGGFSDQEIASILTDKDHYLADTAYKHAQTSDRGRAAKWILEQNLAKARKLTDASNVFKNNVEISDLSTTDAPDKRGLSFIRFEDIALDVVSPSLVEDLIDRKSLVLIVSETNTGKTFFAIDLALHIAQGKAWNNRSVAHGAVVYVAAEGGRGIKKRIIAFKQKHQLESTSIPFRLAIGTINLLDPRADTAALIKEIKETEKLYSIPVAMVVIDTLSRALSGGDENSSDDMGAFVKCADLIREATDATIVIVHHKGKDREKGARGHSLLKGAVDTEITIETSKDSDIKTAKTTKQRDYEYGPAIGFKLETVEIVVGSSDKSVTSCVVHPVNLDVESAFAPKPLTPNARKALETLRGCFELTPAGVTQVTWQKDFTAQHYAKCGRRQTASEAFKKAVKDLRDAERIEIEGEYVRMLCQ